jgi:hypothetical protein
VEKIQNSREPSPHRLVHGRRGLGDGLKDLGSPFVGVKTIDPTRTVTDGSAVDASGYCIITADSMTTLVMRVVGRYSTVKAVCIPDA